MHSPSDTRRLHVHGERVIILSEYFALLLDGGIARKKFHCHHLAEFEPWLEIRFRRRRKAILPIQARDRANVPVDDLSSWMFDGVIAQQTAAVHTFRVLAIM